VVLLSVYTILHAIETGGPGGAETVLRDLVSNLDRSRFRSLVLLPEGNWLPRELQERNVTTVLVDSRAWYDLKLPRAMFRIIRREHVDLIHSHLPGQNFYSCLVGRLTGCPTVVTYHGAPWLTTGGGARQAFKFWFVARTAQMVVAVSDHLKTLLLNAGFPADRMLRIYNGINISRFDEAQSSRLRAELRCSETTKLVGMVANLRQAKGYEYYVRAAGKVLEQFPDTRFVAVGEIDEDIGKQTRELVGALGLGQKFTFLGFRPNVAGILKDLDVFALSSLSEGLSIATIEAMAAGKPVVVTRSGGPQEIVEDNQSGFLVPAADTGAMASKICDLLQYPDKASILGRNARKTVESKFSLVKMVQEYESLYLSVMASR
jgi:glycosyltransferase involved in cell wall biosynthesis